MVKGGIELSWRGTTCEITGWFPAQFSDMKKWCEENCFGQYLIVDFNLVKELHEPNYRSVKISKKQIFTENTIYHLHIKLGDEQDVALFKLTWF